MNQLIASSQLTMSSREIAELTGKRHDHVMRDIQTMLIELHGENGIPKFRDTYVNQQNGQPYPCFNLPKRESLILVAGYSVVLRAKIIDRWEELETKNKEPVIQLPTSNQAFLQLFTTAVAHDERLREQEEKLASFEVRLEKAIESSVWDFCPQNCENITQIRKRMNEKYGLSAKIVDLVVREMPFSPKIAGMVRNGNENANGAHYSVYHKKDVSNVFKIFISECELVTRQFFKHPMIDRSFKIKL